jgi:WD40 repeat protein
MLSSEDACGPGTEVCWRQRPLLLTFNPDGTRLFFVNAFGNHPANVVDVATGTTFFLPRHRFWDAITEGSRFAYTSGDAFQLAVGPDGDVLARFQGNDIRLVRLDAPDGSRWLQVHALGVVSGAFSADGTRLATGSLDGTARVWDTSTADLIFTSPVEPSDVQAVAFSPDGSRVTAVYSDGRVIVYPISLGDTIEMAQARVTRGLTAEECRRYLHVPNCPAD